VSQIKKWKTKPVGVSVLDKGLKAIKMDMESRVVVFQVIEFSRVRWYGLCDTFFMHCILMHTRMICLHLFKLDGWTSRIDFQTGMTEKKTSGQNQKYSARISNGDFSNLDNWIREKSRFCNWSYFSAAADVIPHKVDTKCTQNWDFSSLAIDLSWFIWLNAVSPWFAASFSCCFTPYLIYVFTSFKAVLPE